MKTVLQYVHFFFYTAVNWNVWLAFFMMYHDIRGGRKYGIKTFVPVKLHKLTIADADISKSSPYEAVNYFMLEKLLTAFRSMSAIDSIVDLGCGKGRVMVVAAHFGFRQIIGIDFAKELCDEAIVNMQKTKKIIPAMTWNVVHVNVLDYKLSNEDQVFFMFNPFAEETLVGFLEKLEVSCKLYPRQIYFLYASPEHVQTLVEHGYSILFREKLLNLRGVILERNFNFI